MIDAPAGLRLAVHEPHEAGDPAAYLEADHHRGADLQLCQPPGVLILARGRMKRILDAEQAQVLEVLDDPGQGVERDALEGLRIGGGEGRLRDVDPLDELRVRVGQRDEDGVAAGRVEQRVETALQDRVGVGAPEVLEVDRQLGVDDIEPALRAAACQ